jgi:uncharacterized protein with PQ loop repeat
LGKNVGAIHDDNTWGKRCRVYLAKHTAAALLLFIDCCKIISFLSCLFFAILQMEVVKAILNDLLTPTCTNTILNLDLDRPECFKLLISKLLSFGIVFGALMLKIPQIANILSSKSVMGLSLSSLIMENLGILIALCYNYRLLNPFSTYGEGAFIIVQNILIIFLIFKYRGGMLLFYLLLVLKMVGGYFMLKFISLSFLNSLQISTIFIGITSKLPQILSNFNAKDTGQLSIITTFLQFAGTVARVFTTFQEVGDVTLLVSAAINAILNLIVLVQIIVYGSKKSTNSKKKKKKKIE